MKQIPEYNDNELWATIRRIFDHANAQETHTY